MIVGKEFTFDSAHFLPKYCGKCEQVHGHTYRLRVSVEGEPDKHGLVVDFAVLKKVVQERVIEMLDHRMINEVIPTASCENMARWIWEQLADEKALRPARLYEIQLWETPTSFATYRGE